MYRRHLASAFRESLADTPVVLIAGARQTGKSTLAREYTPTQGYVTFDEKAPLEAARADPEGFLQTLPRPVVIDEVQLVPELFRAIKLAVDRDRRPGSFVLTGSANILLLPKMSESLAGRMEILTLWPLSQGELSGMREGFVDAAFGHEPPVLAPSLMQAPELIARVLEGGFPEVVGRSSPRRVRAWFGSYSSTILQRHVQDISDIDALDELPRILAMIASQATGIANVTKLGRELGIPPTSMTRYLNLLRASYIVQDLPAWAPRLGLRVTRTPKLTLLDSGMVAYLQNATPQRMVLERTLYGALLESFVFMELKKQLGWSDTLARLYYMRTQSGSEVDIVLEATDGRVIAIEVKASTRPDRRDFRPMEALREQLGERFIRGILLYTGDRTLPFGDRIWAMPIDSLWRWGAAPSHD